MANKRYAGIAAARHMSDAPLAAEPDAGPGKRADGASKPSKVRRGHLSEKERAYRKKRLIAVTLTTLVCLTVPTLIILLVLFG